MAALAKYRFFGPMALVLFGPLSWIGLAAEPIAHTSGQTAATAAAGQGNAADPSAEELVRAALKAEAAGNSAERERLLRKALKKDPSYAPARWHLGYVRAGKEWIKWDELQRRAAGDHRIAEYRRRFDELAGKAAGELALARWCRDQGLEDHARTHWTWLLTLEPQNEEALKALGVRWHQGQLMTHEQIVASRQAQHPPSRPEQRANRKDWTKHWAPRVTMWQRMIQEENVAIASSIREELAALSGSPPADVRAAFQGLDAVLMVRSQWQKDADTCRTLSLKWIESLDSMTDGQAIVSLARLAVDHPMPEVRMAAADALKKRPKQLYVRLLISRMGTPIEAHFAIAALPGGGGIYEQSLFREGLDGDFEATHSHSVSVGVSGPGFNPPPAPGYRQTDATRQRDARAIGAWAHENRIKAAQATMRAEAVATAKAATTQRRVGQVNAAVWATNERVQAALSRATGVDLGAHPRPWYDWWVATCSDYFDLEGSPEKPDQRPVYQFYSYAEERSYVSPRPGPSYEAPPAPPPTPGPHHQLHWSGNQQQYLCCFPHGTTVWALTGPMPIDQVKVGDRVLSQHPLSGELAYKPVIGITTRAPQWLTRISLDSEVIAATRGHPFLVAGEGWKMAKQLKVGMRLHTPSGSVVVDGLKEDSELKPFYERLAEKPDADAGDDLAYNLVVDESHTYFVGQHRVLVFDNLFAAMANQLQTATALAR